MSWTSKQLLFLLAGFALNLTLLVHSLDDESGFISIDCGLQTDSGYSEKSTGINYISDATFIDTGESKSLLPNMNNYQQPCGSVRSFPEGARNCYKINVTRSNKYLIRASFLYGNYDGQDKIPEFELHLGPNLWDTVRLRTSVPTDKELIYVPLRNYIHVCLVNTGSGVPFISALELRPLPNASYQTKTGSLALVSRCDTGQRSKRTGYRYPVDILDRIWYAYNDLDNWTQLYTTSTINSDSGDPYQLPSVVMSTASTPKNPCDSLSIIFSLPDKDAEYYGYLHFAEVESLQLNQSRLQYVFWDGAGTFGPFAPHYLSRNTINSTNAWSTRGPYANISITRAKNSTLPPILNAFEIYMVKHFVEAETNQEDVDTIASIKLIYNIKRNWQGDPCAPQDYVWQGVKCNYQEFESPRIISLNLSSSGLTGEIAASISNLSMIQSLDLSNNNLTGPIPEFLSKFQNLTILNLEKNKFTGVVPVGLIERKNNGFLLLSLCDNPHLSRHGSCKLKKKHNFIIPIVVPTAGISILLLVAVAIWWWSLKRNRQDDVIDAKASPQYGSLESTKRQFTYSEILKMTNNFERVLGKGGFGTLYHGYMEHTQVAVKMLSASSVQGFQQFHAEAYSRSSILTWEDRLRIATDAAQATYNAQRCEINKHLAKENFQAKISDFGLSRNFPTNDGTRASSILAGTPGYLDPEFYLSNRLNEKSDIYSFGVVLLEIITSRPVLTRTHDRIHISQWVGFMLANGDINNIVDPRLEGNFNTNSVWKAVEIAMACVSINSIKRPSMSQVVVDLRECLATECARTNHSRVAELDNSNALMAHNSIVRLTPSVR
ncbi:putative LRR receptor-like serine/threonine-protein kinase [Prunus yedoensis var. nudiflora]|uniref:Putative LRR receptor-like serine/threonine-protein kinase n=1 Tax=Prunus yedoensis var. nudiflora TaxID=2094558 RepID=A0A314ZIX1_PRUYE|nr:putative LRR receptor-like serine/threonine-protein kinase [Prunus yedoensis var. nudiflora]